jgi:hypothetical protein
MPDYGFGRCDGRHEMFDFEPFVMRGYSPQLWALCCVPCLPTKTDKLPSGSQWLHEIKHDGFRVIAPEGRVTSAALQPSGQ